MTTSRKQKREQRKRRIRSRVFGRPTKPRLSVFRSNRHLSVQIINDATSSTLVSATDKELKANPGTMDAAKELGALIAKKAKDQGIEKVVFDRNGYKYHGRITALADAARENGLKF